MARPVTTECAVYKGDDLLCIGTIKECADFLGVKTDTVRYYMTPAYQRKVAKRQRSRSVRTVIKIDDE